MRLALAIGLSLMLAACGSSGSGGGIPSSGESGGGGGGDTVDAGMPGGHDFPPTGNQYVDARRCPACHQSQSPQTDGFMSGAPAPLAGNWPSSVKLYGPNLTPDPDTGIGGWTDDQIANAIRNGIDNQGERLCPQMQHFADMSDDEMNSVLGYLRGLKPVKKQVPGSACPPLKY